MADDWRPKLTRIEDPIANDRWRYTTPSGERRTARITVGRPTPYPEARCWYCPVLIEGQTPGIDTVFGSGPVDALMNAMSVIRRFYKRNREVYSLSKVTVPRRKASQKATSSKAQGKRVSTKARRKSST